MAMALLRSGLFDPESYTRSNPDVTGPTLLRARHYVRFGRSEERRFRRGVISRWLMPHLIAGRVAPGSVRRLVNSLEGVEGARRDELVSQFCSKHDIAVEGYRFWQAYAEGSFDHAEAFAADLPDQEAFRAIHQLAVRVLRMQHVSRAFDWGLEALSHGVDVQHLTALADMAEALGRDTPEVNRQLALACLEQNQTPKSSAYNLWRMRMPMIMADPSIVDLHGLLADTLGIDPPIVPPPSSIRGWEAVFAAASWNLFSHTPVRLRAELSRDGDLQGWASVAEDAGPAILLRLPHATHWLAAEENRLSASFIQAFRTISLAALKEGAVIQPVQAGRIHEMSALRPANLPMLGYHSVTTNGRAGLHFKEAAIGGYFSLDPTGFSGWASWPEDVDLSAIPAKEAEAFHSQLDRLIVKEKRTKYRQSAQDAAPDGRYVFFAMQVPDDAVAQHARLSAPEILDALLEHYAGTDMRIVVKPHPYDLSKITQKRLNERVKDHPNLLISRADIHDLLAGARHVVIINSGVGVEALVHLKQVISAGSSDYELVTHSVSDAEELKAVLNRLDDANGVRIAEQDIKRFLHSAYAQHAFTESDVPETCKAMIRKHLLSAAN